MPSPGAYWNLLWTTEWRNVLQFLADLQRLHFHPGWLGAIGALLLLYALEFLCPWHKEQAKLRKGLGTDVFYLLFNTLLMWGLFGDAVVTVATRIFDDVLASCFGITNLVAIHLRGLQMWARFLLFFLVSDLIGYFGHWMLHRVGFLWRFHKVHHSSTQLDVWNAQRFHVGEQLFWPFFNYVPLALIGWPAGEVLAFGVIGSLLSTFSHANVKIPLGPLKYIINNPQLHLWHHAATIDPRRNVNYGDALCVWDYLLGTAYLPEERPAVPLGFDDIDHYPTTFLGQLPRPFTELFGRLRQRLARS
jgi:sterol desaturase/sphingolipid hydroxylase (fatty acid hydroxylase superfamily)